MLATNYDTNSKGLNIEVTACLDTWLSQNNFNENIEMLQYSGYREYSVGFYTDYGQYEIPDKNDLITVKGRTRDILRYLIKEENYCKETFEGDSRESIINELLATLCYSWNDIALSVLKNEDLGGKYLQNYNIDVILNRKDYDFIETRGYCQGDYAICVVDKTKDFIPSEKYIGNLYWDCPILMRVTLNDIELSEDEILCGICEDEYDSYHYDKDKVIEKILSFDCVKELNMNEELKEELEDLIPRELSYN